MILWLWKIKYWLVIPIKRFCLYFVLNAVENKDALLLIHKSLIDQTQLHLSQPAPAPVTHIWSSEQSSCHCHPPGSPFHYVHLLHWHTQTPLAWHLVSMFTTCSPGTLPLHLVWCLPFRQRTWNLGLTGVCEMHRGTLDLELVIQCTFLTLGQFLLSQKLLIMKWNLYLGFWGICSTHI